MDVLQAFDPGKRTGFAVRTADGVYATATLEEPEQIWDAIKEWMPVRVAVEPFYSDHANQYSIHTMELVGSIHGACHVLGIHCHRQMPQARRSYIPDAIKLLEAQGRKIIMTKLEDDHEVDALAHLLLLEDRIKAGDLD